MASPATPGLFFCLAAMILLVFVRAATALLAKILSHPRFFSGICICTNLAQHIFPPCIQWRT